MGVYQQENYNMCGILDLIAECWRSVTEQFFRSFDYQLERYNADREYRDPLEDRNRLSAIYLEPRPIFESPRTELGTPIGSHDTLLLI